MARTCEIPSRNPTERSNWFAAIGTKTARASIASIDLLLAIDLKLK
jgi:hypothetical protein